MSQEVTLMGDGCMGAADEEQQSSVNATPAELCRNHERAESLNVPIKKKTSQTFVLDETPEPMSGVVLRARA
jgi:hypothetical protein